MGQIDVTIRHAGLFELQHWHSPTKTASLEPHNAGTGKCGDMPAVSPMARSKILLFSIPYCVSTVFLLRLRTRSLVRVFINVTRS